MQNMDEAPVRVQDLVGGRVNNSFGAIQSAWGGTSINIWLSAAGVAKCPTTFPQVRLSWI